MVLASFFFASMTVCVKYASSGFNAAELLFARGLLGVFFIWTLAQHQKISLVTKYPGMHAWRSFVGVIAMGCWFYAIALLPLATAITLNYMSSLWIATFIVAGTLLHWRPSSESRFLTSMQMALVFTVLIGFAGVVLMLRPSVQQNQALAALIGLCSGLCSAFAYMQVSALSRIGEPEVRTVFYFSVGTVVAGLIGTAIWGTSTIGTGAWSWRPAVWIVPLGFFATLGQLCMTRAYASAGNSSGTLVVANLQYLGIVFGGLYGIVLFDERLPLSGWFGMALIVASGVIATVLRSREKEKPASLDAAG
jgi:drug/metabolite transporter (DMT)-like permease